MYIYIMLGGHIGKLKHPHVNYNYSFENMCIKFLKVKSLNYKSFNQIIY